MTTKGYITVEPPDRDQKGGLGAVAGLSTSDATLIQETFPNSPFWRSNDRVTATSVEDDFNKLVLRGGVIGGHLFPEGFSRDYNATKDAVVARENTPGDKKTKFKIERDDKPPQIKFGKIKWKEPGDPANPFMPNPSSVAAPGLEGPRILNINPADQQPPPDALKKPACKESRPPFVGPGTDLNPLDASKQIIGHTLGSYLLGTSKVEGE